MFIPIYFFPKGSAKRPLLKSYRVQVGNTMHILYGVEENRGFERPVDKNVWVESPT